MSSVLYGGKLSPSIKLIMNLNNCVAWINGNARDDVAMKRRVKLGYEGASTDHVTHYDEVGTDHFNKIANELLNGVDLHGKKVLDVGCGTGIASLRALDAGASLLVAGDVSDYMLGQFKGKMAARGYGEERVDIRHLDAESLPFEDDSFDVVFSSMILGLIPNPDKAIGEMMRVVKPGGAIAIATHGFEHYYEAIDAYLRAVLTIMTPGYRIEYWPMDEKNIARKLTRTGLGNVRTRRLKWKDDFGSGAKAFDFYMDTTSSWWLTRYQPEQIAKENERARAYFIRKNIASITMDVSLAYANKM